MTTNEIIAQIVGGVLIIICIIIPQLERRKHMILLGFFGNVLWTLQFFIIGGAVAGGVTGIISTARSVVFYSFAGKNKKIPIWILFLFIGAQITGVILTWNSWFCVLLLVSAFNIYGQWQENENVLRIMMAIATMSYGTYCILNGLYTGALNEFLQTGSCIVALWRYKKGETIVSNNKC